MTTLEATLWLDSGTYYHTSRVRAWMMDTALKGAHIFDPDFLLPTFESRSDDKTTVDSMGYHTTRHTVWRGDELYGVQIVEVTGDHNDGTTPQQLSLTVTVYGLPEGCKVVLSGDFRSPTYGLPSQVSVLVESSPDMYQRAEEFINTLTHAYSLATVSIPVVIHQYNPRYPQWYAEERGRIGERLMTRVVGMEPIGSTAVPKLSGRPTIDIMVGVRAMKWAGRCAPFLQELGYWRVAEMQDEVHYRRIVRPNELQFDLYLCEYGGTPWQCHLRFRDTLRTNPDVAQAYHQLKHRLWGKFRSEAPYLAGKRAFFEAIIAIPEN